MKRRLLASCSNNKDDPNDPQRHEKRRQTKPPAFCDYTCTVTADAFGASRLPELQALLLPHTHVPLANPTDALASGGRKTSDRHMRRRSTSHRPKRWYRPQHRNNKNKPMESSSADERNVPSDEPLQTTTTNIEDDKSRTVRSTLSRKARRRTPHLLRSPHERWKMSAHTTALQPTPSTTDAPITTDLEKSTKTPTTTAATKKLHLYHQPQQQQQQHWMPSHVWHAKRFRMGRNLFGGWTVPMLHSHRGCAAVLRYVREQRCIVHDATWCHQPVWMELFVPTRQHPDNKAVLTKQMQKIIPNFTWNVSGEGMLHSVDDFPHGAVAPVSWIASRERWFQEDEGDHHGASTAAPEPLSTTTTTTTTASASECKSYLYFFIHPACQQALCESLTQVMQDVPHKNGPFCGLNGGVSYYQLRGGCAAMNESLRSCLSDVAAAVLIASIPRVEDLTHGQVVELQSNPLLLLQCVRPQQYKASHATSAVVYGVDIIAVPAANELFLALVKQGDARAVGMTEMASLHLAYDPPMPLFPRDFPDTNEGRHYWSGGGPDEQNGCWSAIRWYNEGGDGRIRDYQDRPLLSVSFDALSADGGTGGDPAKANAVVVRGAYVEPFAQALRRATEEPDDEPLVSATITSRSRRRKHRSGAKECSIVMARKLSKTKALLHRDFCRDLVQKMVLPALLAVHVQVDGKGIFRPGAPLFALTTGHPDRPIGFTTSATFCTARGRFHGLGFVNAAAFLNAVASANDDEPSSAIVVLKSHPQARTLCLKTRVQGRSDLLDAILSLVS
jgi:hypothetical protein